MRNDSQNAFWLDVYKGLIYKALSIIFMIYNVRIMVRYLGQNIYGDWVTISSVVSWMGIGDLGLGYGLRNEISKYYANEEFWLINLIIKKTKKVFMIISLCTVVAVLILLCFSRWFNFIPRSFYVPIIITAIFFAASIYLGRYISIFLGVQQVWVQSFNSALGLIISVIIYKCMDYFSIKPCLILSALIFGCSTVIPLLIVFLFFYFGNSLYKNCNDDKKHISYENSIDIKRIICNGLAFFVLQLTSTILFSTDSVIINILFGAENVTRYSVINQMYTVGASIFGVILASFWSGVSIHFQSGDIIWIRDGIRKMLKTLIAFSVGIVIVSVFINNIIYIWMGNSDIYYEKGIVIIFAIYCFFECFQAIYGNINYGINNTRMIMILGIVSALGNIPLSVFFAKYLCFGITGVKLGTFVSLFPSWIFIIVRTEKLIANMTKNCIN